jgi:transposase
MSYVRQGTLFTFENFVAERDDNERLVLTLAALPDETLLCWLREQRQQRRDDYPYEMLWRCLIAKYVYQIKSYAELIRELRRNGSLRWLVGIETLARVPHDYHFSRLLKVLSSREGLQQLQAMFGALVSQLSEALPEMGARLAVDATAVHAYSNEMRKQKRVLPSLRPAVPGGVPGRIIQATARRRAPPTAARTGQARAGR